MTINCQGGEYAFDGTTTPTDGTLVYDFTDLLQSSATLKCFYLGMSDDTEEDIATLSAFKIVGLTTDPVTYVVSGLVPRYADNEQNVYIDEMPHAMNAHLEHCLFKQGGGAAK